MCVWMMCGTPPLHFTGVQCYDVPAPGVGIMCGLCPSGYIGDGYNCIGQFNILRELVVMY